MCRVMGSFGLQPVCMTTAGSRLLRQVALAKRHIRRRASQFTTAAGCSKMQQQKSKHVAVIGAGAAGLVVLRELLREGHTAVAFEQEMRVGGTWVYVEGHGVKNGYAAGSARTVHTDILPSSAALHASPRIHSSMYKNLRTNLPRELMGFTNFPFTTDFSGSKDARRFCGHAEVLVYLEAFAAFYDLQPRIRYGRRVLRALPLPQAPLSDSSACGPRWRVTTCATSGPDQPEESEFDAVIVCNGHYSDPRTPEVAGAGDFPGRQMHSHSYRDNRAFAGETVVVVGASASGEDISREIAEVADRVYLSARTWHTAPDWDGAWDAPLGRHGNLLRRPELGALLPDGGVTWAYDCPSVPRVDTVIYATGYHYTFDFIRDSGVVKVSDNKIFPLFKHVFPPECPSLALIGVPWKVVPFPQMELQATWVARVLSGRARLPSCADMQAAIDADDAELAARRVPQRKAHLLGDAQWAYNDWLAAAAGPEVPRLPAWRAEMNALTGEGKRAAPDSYRDDTTYPEPLLGGIARDLKQQQHALLAMSA